MAQGYSCEVIDPVPENSLCHHCSLLARKLTFSSCCGESYCHACLAAIQDEGKPCPACGEESFTTVVLAKHQKQIESLQVYCSMKKRGCVWSGTLDQLDTHLDPHLDNCQYVDTKCPLNCLQTIPKNKVDHHVAQKCSKRPHVCQHCGYKATYEEVVDTHLPECKYVPLQCPNFCGVCCEREDMEDHLKMCRLEEVTCEFSAVGCQERFVREKEDEHLLKQSQSHLCMMAAKVIRLSEEVNPKLLQQEEKVKNQESTIENLEKMVHELQLEVVELKEKLEKNKLNWRAERKKMDEKCEEEKKVLERKCEKYREEIKKECSTVREEMDLKYISLLTKMQEDQEKEELRLWRIWKGITTGIDKRFQIEQYHAIKAQTVSLDIKSPPMHTHINGYKFCLGVSISENGRDENISFNTYAMKGLGDEMLKWPAWIKLTVEILNHQNGTNAKATMLFSKWYKPAAARMVPRVPDNLCEAAVKLCNLEEYLLRDTMFFHVSDIVVLCS